jgi:hypothetical protein
MLDFYRPTDGQKLVAGREAQIASPRDAATLGFGMVCQHFTLAPSLTGAENLVMSRADAPLVIDWRKERTALVQFSAMTDKCYGEFLVGGWRGLVFDPLSRPLWDLAFAVKDNIDVAGMPTTAACPAFSYAPAQDATVVALLKRAGALCLGKTNMDQFATGPVGVRTPYPAMLSIRRSRPAGRRRARRSRSCGESSPSRSARIRRDRDALPRG